MKGFKKDPRQLDSAGSSIERIQTGVESALQELNRRGVMSKTPPKARKSELTRQKILDAALESFLEHGFEATTMKMIAERAGVSMGNAYYYFASKDALMVGYYSSLSASFQDKAQPVLASEKTFTDRLRKVLEAWVENARPSHEFARSYFRYAADPTSPLSPFSEASKHVREQSIDVYRQVTEGSEKLRIPHDVRRQLPELLWLYQMALVLYWVYDESVDQARTLALIDRTVPLLAKLLNMSRVPGLRSVASDFMTAVEDFKSF